jgi:hypothetical protein
VVCITTWLQILVWERQQAPWPTLVTRRATPLRVTPRRASLCSGLL